MTRAPAPIWAARPTRFVGLPRGRARTAAALLALLVALALLALRAPGPPPVSRDPTLRAEEQSDVALYRQIVDRVRHGEPYYPTAADALRTGDYPLKPFVTFRLPTLARAEALLGDGVSLLLLRLLVAAAALAWYRRLRGALRSVPARVVAALLIAGGMVVYVQAELAPFHEVWAGPAVALSLAVRRPGRWVAAAAIGLSAALVRETAALYLLLMAAIAWVEGERRETLGWGTALLVLAAVLLAHAHAVAGVVRPLDPASPGWAGMLGVGFFVRALAVSTALAVVPLWLAAPLVALALFGWAAWRDPAGTRVVAVLAAYAAVLATAGRVDTFYWGLLVAGLLLPGLAFAPDAARELWASLGHRRRITVTRVVR